MPVACHAKVIEKKLRFKKRLPFNLIKKDNSIFDNYRHPMSKSESSREEINKNSLCYKD